MPEQLTPEQINELRQRRWELTRLLAMGATSVSHGDKSATLKSTTDIKGALDEIDRQLAGRRKTRIIKIYSKRGV